MSKTMIALKIDVTKIDKNKLFAGKNGAKYLDVILIETPSNRYGDNFVAVQGVSKEEREQGVKGAILGNAKYLGRKSAAPPTGGTPDPSDDAPPF